MKCPECNRDMTKIAQSGTNPDGSRDVSYSCPFCKTVVRVKE